jgi:hypothetical protein
VYSTFVMTLGFLYGCCGLSSTFTLHLAVSCLAISCLQLLFLTLADVRYVVLYVVLVCISLIFKVLKTYGLPKLMVRVVSCF